MLRVLILIARIFYAAQHYFIWNILSCFAGGGGGNFNQQIGGPGGRRF